MKEPGNVKEVAALHPDMLGFIFYKASPRYAGDLSPRALERLPAAIGKVGVFVNAETGFIENIVRRYKMDTIQLHGDEPPEMGHYFVQKGYRVIKAFGIEEAGDFQRTLPYESACQLFLFDTVWRDREIVRLEFIEPVRGECTFFLKWRNCLGK